MYLYRFVHTYRRSCIHLQYVQYIYILYIQASLGRRTHTIQHRHTCGKTMGDNGGLGKADAPSSTGTHMWRDTGRQWETRGEKTLGRQTHHPTNGNKKGDHGGQGETRPWKRGHTILAMGNKTGRARFAPGIFSPLPGDFFPFNNASIPPLFTAC